MEYELKDGHEIYQRTRLELGPLYLSAQGFSADATINSKTYVSSGPLSSLYFTAEESIPEHFLTEDKTPEDFIQYMLVTNGKEYPIKPSNRGGTSPGMYYINSPLTTEARGNTTDTGYIDDLVYTWNLKVILHRPSTSPESTPSVSGFRFTYTYE